MTSLYKRANARQVLVLRIVEGAVRNALHAHPGQQVSERFPRSVAKRAAGTLTAQWAEVLATPFGSSDRGAAANYLSAAPHGSVGGFNDGAAASGHLSIPNAGAGASERNRRSQLQTLWAQTAKKAGAARVNGQMERHAALVEVLQAIAALQLGPAKRNPDRGIYIGRNESAPPTLGDIWPKGR